MALAKSSLGFPVQVSPGNTTTIYTVASSKKAYIRTILIYHNREGGTSTLNQIAKVYVVPNISGSAGTASDADCIGRVTLAPDDTLFFEMQYPITLENNGDTIQVENDNSTGSTSKLNVMVLGDKES